MENNNEFVVIDNNSIMNTDMIKSNDAFDKITSDCYDPPYPPSPESGLDVTPADDEKNNGDNINKDMVISDVSGNLRMRSVQVSPYMTENKKKIHNTTLFTNNYTSLDTAVREVARQMRVLIIGVDSMGHTVRGSNIINDATIVTQRPSKKNSIEITKKLITTTYNKFTELINIQHLSTANIVLIVASAIKLVEQITNMKKGRRVELILAVMRKYIDRRQTLSDTDKDEMHELVENILPIVYAAFSDGWIREKVYKWVLKCRCKCCM